MSTGYADYLVVLARETDREFNRDALSVEVPFLIEEYQTWLDGKVAPNTAQKYVEALGRLDKMICSVHDDFYVLFADAFFDLYLKEGDHLTAGYMKGCKLIADYEAQIGEEIKFAEESERTSPEPQTLDKYRSAFRKYADFLKEQMQAVGGEVDMEKKRQEFEARIKQSQKSAGNLYMANRFRRWIEANGINGVTIKSIKQVNRELFCKTGLDLLALVPGYVESRNAAKLEEMFTAMDDKLTERIDSYDETEMSTDDFKKARKSLRAYAEFVNSLLQEP